MEALLDDLLAYSRVGRYDYADTTVDTGALVNNIINLLARPESFQITMQAAMPTLVTAQAPLELVLRNLIGNAIKHHNRSDGHVHITARSLGKFVEFGVADDGPGIAPQFHTRIFQMFQTLKPRTQQEGSGIGLAVVKKTVESRNGTIRVESAEGEGATFYFTWPQSNG